MELYTKTSYELSRHLTLRYSTSFGQSIKLFEKSIRPDIFAIYSLVRIADEIVDTYEGKDQKQILDQLETEVYHAIAVGYSANPIVHAFALTAQKYDIKKDLIAPFFESMRMDLSPQVYTPELYRTYIYGSAEVVGLMCLKVFCQNDPQLYDGLLPGARALGSAYQKVNFLRDIASDFNERGRVYFPGVTYEKFNEKNKSALIKDIKKDFDHAAPAVLKLPLNARKAVALSYTYYLELLKKIEQTPAAQLKHQRIRIPNGQKLVLFMKQLANPKGTSWQK